MLGSSSGCTRKVGVLARGALRGVVLRAQDYVDRDRRAKIKWVCDYDWYNNVSSSSTVTGVHSVVGIRLIIRRLVEEAVALC